MHEKDRVFGGFVVLTILAVAAVVALAPVPSTQLGTNGNLLAFNSYSQMKQVVSQTSNSPQYKLSMVSEDAFAAGALAPSAATSTSSFTTTNVQVEGVEEPDFVKTDGTYLYVAHGSNVSIILTHQTGGPTTVSVLRFEGQVLGLLLSDSRLIVIESGNSNRSHWWTQSTSLIVYDVSDPANPAEVRVVSVEGSYIDSRLTGGYLYAVLQQPSFLPLDNGTYAFAPPQLKDGKTVVPIAADDTYYNPKSLVPMGQYTIILTMSVQDGSHTQKAVLTGWGSTVYATSSSIYLAFPDRMSYPMLGGVGIALPGLAPAIRPAIFWWGWGTNTTIFKVAITGDHTDVTAQGTIPGTVLNQFSMDEYNGNLRVATNSYSHKPNQTAVQQNNVYVLDSDMKVMGALEGLAPNERIYAVRFLGDVGYMVTYENVDPLFVLSLSDPTHPVVLSGLVLTGFSNYLHPIGSGYLVGIGKQTTPALNEPGFVFYLGVKVSMFRVFPNGSSVEVSRLVIGDRGSDTPVSSDHRAFTFDSARGIMAFPIQVNVVDNSTGGISPWDYGKVVFQGAYLFHVTSSGVFQKLGSVTQISPKDPIDQSYNLYVSRVLLIGDNVYTVSDNMVQVNSLADFSLVGSVRL